jgi:hypothetical protein
VSVLARFRVSIGGEIAVREFRDTSVGVEDEKSPLCNGGSA